MQLNLILYCVLLFCLEFSDSIPHDSNSQKQSGIYNIRPLYPAREARIPRSHQAWNQGRPYQLPPQYQPIPQINWDSNFPNNNKKPVPNAQKQIPQSRLPIGYPNQQRVPSSATTFPNRANQADKIVNIPEAQKALIQNIPDKLLAAKHQQISQSQLKQHSVGNPTLLKQNAPRFAEKQPLPNFPQQIPYQLPPQYQPIPQINWDPNLPNNNKKPVPNAQQQILQAQHNNGYRNQQRVLRNGAPIFPNRPNQAEMIINIPKAQKLPSHSPEKLVIANHQPISQFPFKQQSVGNPSVLKQNAPRTADHILPTQNEAKLVNIAVPKYNLPQKVPERPSLVVNARDSYVNKPAAGENNQSFKTFAPRIPSRPSQVNTPKVHLNQLHVKMIPSREIIAESEIPKVAPVRFEDRYLASASNPVETITKNLVPPNYNIKQFVSNSNIRNVLATTKHKRRFLVIHPNGTVEHVDKLETVSQRNPNYVLIRAGDIISNPIQKAENVQKVVAKPVNNNKLNTSIVDLANAPVKQPPTAQNSGNISKLAKPVSTPPNKSTVHIPKDAQPLISAGKITVVSSTQKAQTNISSHNETSTLTTPPKMKIIFSNSSSNIKNPNDNSHKDPKPVTKVDTYVSKPINEKIKVLADVENSIVRKNNENKKPNNKPIIIYGTNVTHTNYKENPKPAIPAKPVKPMPTPADAAKEAVVKASSQSPSKVNDSPVVKAVAITETKSKVNTSTPVSNEVNVSTVDINKTSVHSSDNFNERKKPNNTPITIYETNVTHKNDKENKKPAKPAKPAKLVKPLPTPADAAKEAVVKARPQSPSKVNDSPGVKAVAITETKPKVNTSTPVRNEVKELPVGNEVNVLPVDKNKTSVYSKPLKDKSAASSALPNASAKVNLSPTVKAEAIAKPCSNSTEAKTPESKPPSINLITQTQVSDKENQKHIKTPIDDKPMNSTAIPSKQEVKEEKNIPENPDAAEDYSPVVWFRTSDPAFWEQLKDKDDVVYFFQIHNRPKVEYNTTRTIFPNGTVFEETTKYIWENEGDPPIVTKTTKIIDPENPKGRF